MSRLFDGAKQNERVFDWAEKFYADDYDSDIEIPSVALTQTRIL